MEEKEVTLSSQSEWEQPELSSIMTDQTLSGDAGLSEETPHEPFYS